MTDRAGIGDRGAAPRGEFPAALGRAAACAASTPVGSAGWRRWLVAAAIVVLAINLRPSVNAVGVVIPELRAATGISATLAGVLLALPTLAFGFLGAGTPPLAARLGSHRVVIAALVALVLGQVLRSLVPGYAALFSGSVLALAGVAAANVLMPGLVRLHFPGHVTAMTALYTVMLTGGGTIGAGLTLPIEHALGGDWRTGLGMWAVTAAVALGPWVYLAARFRPPERASRASRLRMSVLAGSRTAWALAVFFGCQALQAYVLIGWLPAILISAGVSDEMAAAQVAIIAAIGIPVAAVAPAMLGRVRRPAGLMIALVALYLAGYAWLLLWPGTAPWVAALLLGMGGGAFPVALTLIALRSRTAHGTITLSAFTQSIGYLIASIGPIGFGFLHDASGGWTVPLIALTPVLAVMLISGLLAAQDRYVENELEARQSTSAQ